MSLVNQYLCLIDSRFAEKQNILRFVEEVLDSEKITPADLKMMIDDKIRRNSISETLRQRWFEEPISIYPIYTIGSINPREETTTESRELRRHYLADFNPEPQLFADPLPELSDED